MRITSHPLSPWITRLSIESLLPYFSINTISARITLMTDQQKEDNLLVRFSYNHDINSSKCLRFTAQRMF